MNPCQKSYRIFHCDKLENLLDFLREFGFSDKHYIPLNKIFHTLARKGFLKTVIVEDKVFTDESKAEAALYQDTSSLIKRLHFFSKEIKKIEEVKYCGDNYGGYCDLRNDEISVMEAYITKDAIFRPKDTYAFLCCKMKHSTIISAEEVETNLNVSTFPFLEKDHKGVMCSQASILSLIKYWNDRCPDMFSSLDVSELNRKAGVPQSQIKKGRGLYPLEIWNFFQQEGAHVLPLIYDPYIKGKEKIPRSLCGQDIYGFIESGFPVMLCLDLSGSNFTKRPSCKNPCLFTDICKKLKEFFEKTRKNTQKGHALVCIGHTYDRNNWEAMADVAYFDKVGPEKNNYHANTTWIHNIIVHDDNFGPFYFMPISEIENYIIVGYVVLPDDSIKQRPTEAAAAAFKLLSKQMKRKIPSIFDHIVDVNQKWLEEFSKHLNVTCGDGLVLRPIVIQGKKILEIYIEHPFYDCIKSSLSGDEEMYFWYIELTWPDIYCHRQLCCGSVIFCCQEGLEKFLFLHVPGVLFANKSDDVRWYICEQEDPPREHFKQNKR